VEEPPKDQRIWRYLTLPSFLYLLVQKRLHFSRLWNLEDHWEGRVSRAQVNDLCIDLEDAQHLDLAPRILDLYRTFVASCAISCWHASDTESVAMWKLYATGPDGVAISTTVGKVDDSLNHMDHINLNCHIGTVRYIDHESNVFTERPPERCTALQCLFEKRREYAHEREVRFVLVNPKSTEIPLQDLSFIEQIIISPAFPAWAVSSLQSMQSAVGVTITLENSALKSDNC
jgi:hypothetical protein